MGIAEFLGNKMGKLAVQAQEIQTYKREYEGMSDDDLKREYMRLKNRTGTECKNRFLAVSSVLRDRGYGQK